MCESRSPLRCLFHKCNVCSVMTASKFSVTEKECFRACITGCGYKVEYRGWNKQLQSPKYTCILSGTFMVRLSLAIAHLLTNKGQHAIGSERCGRWLCGSRWWSGCEAWSLASAWLIACFLGCPIYWVAVSSIMTRHPFSQDYLSQRSDLQSLLPLHTAVAAARLTSCLGADAKGCRSLSQGMLCSANPRI